jgi:hypothetical protein
VNPDSCSIRNDGYGADCVEKLCLIGAAVADPLLLGAGDPADDGRGTGDAEALFYGFSLERHVPEDPLLRKIGRFVDLSGLRAR